MTMSPLSFTIINEPIVDNMDRMTKWTYTDILGNPIKPI